MHVDLLLAAALLAANVSPSPSPAPTPAFETSDYRFSTGGATLVGRLFAPRGATKFPLVILVQGADYDDANASVYWRLIAHTFAKNGIGSFSFNKRGVGGSTGVQTDDFDVQGRDVAAACAFAKTLPNVDADRVGYYGISQGGWIVPQAVRECPGTFVILVSASGGPPIAQVRYYLEHQYRSAGMSAREVAAALRLHDALAAYYRTGEGYRDTQSLVTKAIASPWYAKLGKVDYRQEVPASGVLPTPEELRREDRLHPDVYAFYRSADTWSVSPALYQALTAPILFVYGGRDDKVDVTLSIAVFQRAMQANQNPDVTLHIFEAASHDIQIGERVLPGYREYIAQWVLSQIHSVTPAIP